MKILELKFKNLNSLYGHWSVDFREPEYISDGIFALTGPTGAGKSTILDAICLGLYGATPRLGRITKSSNEIMSRQTAECYSEVVFDSRGGRYRCYWEQHRSRKKADGNLTEAVHEISDAETGKIIENRKSRVIGVIEEKTGMDFERFTRSVLLAQGSFDNFLKADQEQKSRILEQITGTEIYSTISVRVHERLREEKNSLDILRNDLSAINLLEEIEEVNLKREIEEKTEEIKKITHKGEENRNSSSWLKEINAIETELVLLSENEKDIKNEIEKSDAERSSLRSAVKASVFENDYGLLSAERRQQTGDIIDLEEEEGKYTVSESIRNEKKSILENAEKNTLAANKELSDAVPAIRKARLMAQIISEKAKILDQKRISVSVTEDKIRDNNVLKDRYISQSEEWKNEARESEEFLMENNNSEEISSLLPLLREKIQALLSSKEELESKISEKREIENKKVQSDKLIEEHENKCREIKKSLDNKEKMLKESESGLEKILEGRNLREYKMEKAALERELNLISRIESLESQRMKLEDGKPCPLCGSLEHPFAEGNIPEKGEAEKKIENIETVLEKAENQNSLIRNLEKEINKLSVETGLAEKKYLEAVNESKISEKMLSSAAGSVNDLKNEISVINETISELLLKAGLDSDESGKEASETAEILEKQVENWKKHLKMKENADREIREINTKIKETEAVVNILESSHSEQLREISILESEYEKMMLERSDVFGDRDPDSEEERLNSSVSRAEAEQKTAKEEYDRALLAFNTVANSISSLKIRTDERKVILEKMEKDFLEKISGKGFAGENHFLKARIPVQERERIEKNLAELDKRNTEISTRISDRTLKLENLKKMKLTDMSLEEVEREYSIITENLEKLRNETASGRHRLTENEAAKEKINDKQNEITRRKSEYIRWEKLHSLIGSADGKKYRTFAQGITFEMMVGHANRQLEKMTDRYLLMHDRMSPLDLEVADNYQAGEIRSVKNLSGGESFIVSLALALGLSKMASRKVSVDSLFLDEGFGTLDEDALETALETLSSLQQDGKLIGVISHVPALKERITTRISVNPVSGGRSRITGPGCMEIR